MSNEETGNISDVGKEEDNGGDARERASTSDDPGNTEAGSDGGERNEWLFEYFAKALGISSKPKPESRLDDLSLEGIARYINSEKCSKIVTMAGAGISTSAGIPDFRTPGTGLYSKLQELNLANPNDVFNIDFFHKDPVPFYTLRKTFFADSYKPTSSHYFIKLLDMKGKLLRHFTQNVDTLEQVAGIPQDKLVEAHGSFGTATCCKCQYKYTRHWVKDKIEMSDPDMPVPYCDQTDCHGVVRPDIVFFGESLPERFGECISDLEECDMLIIMGTSLVVQPFASMTLRVAADVPRLYINLEKTEDGPSHPLAALVFGGGFSFDQEDNIRDVFWQGKCDDGCQMLADLLGWGDELKDLVTKEHALLDKALAPEAVAGSSKPQAKATCHKPGTNIVQKTGPSKSDGKLPTPKPTPARDQKTVACRSKKNAK